MKAIITIFVISALLTFAFANTCGGNCPSNRCPSCPCGTSANYVNIAAQCQRHSWG